MFVRFMILTVCLGSASLFAQSSSGTISGIVRDASGAVISGAQVAVLNRSTQAKRAVTTNGLGTFLAPLLDPGNYDVSINKPGFKSFVQTQLTLTINQVARLEVTLDLTLQLVGARDEWNQVKIH